MSHMRDIVRRRLQSLAGEIQYETSVPRLVLMAKQARDLMLEAATELDGPDWKDTEVPLAIADLIESQERFDTPIDGQEFQVRDTAQNDKGQRNIRRLFNYLEVK